ARPKRRRALRLPLLARGALGVVDAAARAVLAVGADLRDVQQQRPQRRAGGADRAGADERRDAAGDPEGRGRRGYGFTTISPSVSTPRMTPSAVRNTVERGSMYANRPSRSARLISRSRW